jgi:uncharacterized membrane protein YtjA (UPF0391 family)
MLNWAVIFLVIAIVAAVFGFSGLAHESAWIAQVLFLVFVVMFVLSGLAHFGQRTLPGRGSSA